MDLFSSNVKKVLSPSEIMILSLAAGGLKDDDIAEKLINNLKYLIYELY